MKKLLIIILLLTLISFSSGCGVALLVGAGGYAESQSRKGTKAKAKYTKLYNKYKLRMEQINLNREKAGLQPKPIMNFEEWLNLQPLSPAEANLFEKTGVQTPKEIKEQEKTRTDTYMQK
ncbi:MAG: hypothetical protein V2A65_11350 [Candidatus Omnitrophota bacterium]